MAKREVIGRYQGSLLGVLFSFINPLTVLAVYRFVVVIVFKVRRKERVGHNFSIYLICGHIFPCFLPGCLARAPLSVKSNVNYLNKAVFPLDALSWVVMLNAFFHFVVSALKLFIVQFIVTDYVLWSGVFLPLFFLPVALICSGSNFCLPSLDVFLKDIGQLTIILPTVVFFLCPIFYPLGAILEYYQFNILLISMPILVEQERNVLVTFSLPNFSVLAIYTLTAFAFWQIAFIWFKKTRPGFSDVL